MEPRLQALVERSAPERAELRNGKRARIDYASPGGPSIAMKIQDLYGVTETPRLFGGRVPLTVSILGPNHRPVQVTQDLAGFWTGAYPAIRKELSRRYPKHEWR
jgi:ATP-dependent helicase HrpB